MGEFIGTSFDFLAIAYCTYFNYKLLKLHHDFKNTVLCRFLICSPFVIMLSCVYQIAVKEEMRRQHMAEHERRLAEIKKADQARRDRERRSRK